MRTATVNRAAALLALAALLAGTARAQLAPPNAAGVAMGHLHYLVRDVEANKRFWLALGGEPKLFGTTEVVSFPDVLVFLREAESSGGTEGSVVNHVAFRVRSLAAIEAAGFELSYFQGLPGIASVTSPEGERVELFDDELATNLWFEPDAATTEPSVERHGRKLEVPIVAHHIHLNVPETEIAAARDWYARHFGGVAGKRWRYDAVDLPGININISAAEGDVAPTRGRRLDHIGFEVENLEAFCRALAAQGIVFDRPYSTLPSGLGLAFLTDPWGTYIELTEGLREL